MKLKITKEVFEFVEIPASAAEVYSIRIKKGRYKNVIYKYGPVKFTEDKENGQLGFNFDFGVDVGSNRYSKKDLVNSEKFKKFIADILIFIMEEDLASQLEDKWKDHYGKDYPFPVVTPGKDAVDTSDDDNFERWSIREDDEHTTTDTKEDM
tara:strand:- start:970 stop:1425 length:456 start_codon:yes stop_codon:yes gene_type:complete